MWSSSSSSTTQNRRAANIRRYLGREISFSYSRSLDEDDNDSIAGGVRCSKGSNYQSSPMGETPMLFSVSSSSSSSSEDGGCSSSFQEEDSTLSSTSSLGHVRGPQQRRRYEHRQRQRTTRRQLVELDTDNLDIEHYMLSVFDKGDDSSTIHTGGTASTSFSSFSNSTTSTRRRHRGAYRGRKKADTKAKSSTTAPKLSWVESMEHRAFAPQTDMGLEWTPRKGWQRKKEANSGWDPSPISDAWSVPNAIFDRCQNERIEI